MGTRSDEWSDAAVRKLLQYYSRLETSNGAGRAKGWRDLVAQLNTECGDGRIVFSYSRCKNKMDVMKRRYKHEKIKSVATGAPSKWQWYSTMEEIGNLRSVAPAPNGEQIDKLTINGSSTSDIMLGQAENASPVSRSSSEGIARKRKRCCCAAPYAKEVTRTITEAFEQMETRRIELVRELEARRCEMQLQVARMIASSIPNAAHLSQAGSLATEHQGNFFAEFLRFLQYNRSR